MRRNENDAPAFGQRFFQNVNVFEPDESLDVVRPDESVKQQQLDRVQNQVLKSTADDSILFRIIELVAKRGFKIFQGNQAVAAVELKNQPTQSACE